MTALDLIPDAELEPVTKPPTRWRNWWRSASNKKRRCIRCGTIGYVHPTGEVFAGHCVVWPSKDAAHTHAERVFSTQVQEGRSAPDEYLGAFPEGERP